MKEPIALRSILLFMLLAVVAMVVVVAVHYLMGE
jgi:hypothetical protein